MALYDHLTTDHVTALKAGLDRAGVVWREVSLSGADRHLRLEVYDGAGCLWVIAPLTLPNVPAGRPASFWSAYCPQNGSATEPLTATALAAHLRVLPPAGEAGGVVVEGKHRRELLTGPGKHMACVNRCSCGHGYIRDAVFDEDTGKSVPRDYVCGTCGGDQCMNCVYGEGCG